MLMTLSVKLECEKLINKLLIRGAVSPKEQSRNWHRLARNDSAESERYIYIYPKGRNAFPMSYPTHLSHLYFKIYGLSQADCLTTKSSLSWNWLFHFVAPQGSQIAKIKIYISARIEGPRPRYRKPSPLIVLMAIDLVHSRKSSTTFIKLYSSIVI